MHSPKQKFSTAKPEILLSNEVHKDAEIVALRFQYDRELIKVIKKIDGMRWSQSRKCWYFRRAHIINEVITKTLSKYFEIKYKKKKNIKGKKKKELDNIYLKSPFHNNFFQDWPQMKQVSALVCPRAQRLIIYRYNSTALYYSFILLNFCRMKIKQFTFMAVFIFCALLARGQTPFSGTSGNFTTDSKQPVISVISPNGGEAYYFAEPLQIKWDATDDSFGATPVIISVSTDGGATYTDVASGLPDTDSAYVSAPQEITDLAMVKIFVQDEFGLTAYDESDNVFSLAGVYIDLKAFLQGPFAGSGMLTFLNMQGYLPTTQPYSSAPWNYSGTETANPIPNSNVVDWVLIELREAPDAASATQATAIAQRAGFILNDGTVTDIDGSSRLQFGFDPSDNLFAVVFHRNHLPIMSAYPLTETAGVYTYDFTVSENGVYGGSLAHSELVSGTWGMTSGDANADGDIDNMDKDDIWLPDLYNSGYLPGDFDMNGTVLDSDKQTMWEPNVGKSRKLP